MPPIKCWYFFPVSSFIYFSSIYGFNCSLLLPDVKNISIRIIHSDNRYPNITPINFRGQTMTSDTRRIVLGSFRSNWDVVTGRPPSSLLRLNLKEKRRRREISGLQCPTSESALGVFRTQGSLSLLIREIFRAYPVPASPQLGRICRRGCPHEKGFTKVRHLPATFHDIPLACTTCRFPRGAEAVFPLAGVFVPFFCRVPLNVSFITRSE